MDGTIVGLISNEDAQELYEICRNITIPLQKFKRLPDGTSTRGGRSNMFGDHRAALLGYTIARFKPRSIGPQLSAFSIKQPKLYDCLVKLSQKYFPEHNWKTIQLNHNVTCSPHLDRKNNGPSIIFALGDYTGSNLCIENTEGTKEINICNTIVMFDGSLYKHWNTPLLSPDKYSFVFYA